MRISHCYDCQTRPEVVKFWHDKENRALNHLPYGLECRCGKSSVRASSKREAIDLHNDAMSFHFTTAPKPVTFWDRLYTWLGMV